MNAARLRGPRYAASGGRAKVPRLLRQLARLFIASQFWGRLLAVPFLLALSRKDPTEIANAASLHTRCREPSEALIAPPLPHLWAARHRAAFLCQRPNVERIKPPNYNGE